MKSSIAKAWRPLGAWCLIAAGISPGVAEAAWTSQTFQLKQGWNLVHLKVNPADASCKAVFGGTAVSAATWYKRDVADGGTGEIPAPNSRNWHADESMASTFAALVGGECYYLKADAACSVTVKGVPAKPKGLIVQGQESMAGIYAPRESAGKLTLTKYFEPVADKITGYKSVIASDPGAGERTLTGSHKPADGEAVWVSAGGEGAFTYTGALAVDIGGGAGAVLKWERSAEAQSIKIKNESKVERTVTVEFAASENPPEGQGTKAGDVKLLVGEKDYSAGFFRWKYGQMTFPYAKTVPAGEEIELRVRPDLNRMTAAAADATYLGLLKISDKGTEGLPEEIAAGTCEHKVGLSVRGDLPGARRITGLWQGGIAVTGVNRARSASAVENTWNSEEVQDAMQAFEYRILMHYDNEGKLRLLKQVFICTPEGADASVLFTKRETAKQWKALNPRGTVRLVAAANFPYAGMPQELAASSGEFASEGGVFGCTVAQTHDEKTNPFVHAFHPQHDNLEFVNGKPRKKAGGTGGTGDYESWAVSRQFSFRFAGSDPTEVAGETDWNRTVCGGTVTETVHGLTSEGVPIKAEGAFRLNKLNEAAMLDPVLTTSAE